jgi:hypothetical protein
MSDNSSSGTNDQASGSDQGKGTVAYESYSKVLSEKKKTQEKLSEAQSRLEEYEQAKLEAEGKLKEALENQKKLTEKFKNDNVEIIKRVGSKAAKSQFTREIEKLGCVDAEAAFQLTDFSDLEMDAEFEYDSKKLQDKIQGLTKSRAYLFKKDFKLPNDLNPSNGQMPTKNLSDLSENEIKELLKQAK